MHELWLILHTALSLNYVGRELTARVFHIHPRAGTMEDCFKFTHIWGEKLYAEDFSCIPYLSLVSARRTLRTSTAAETEFTLASIILRIAASLEQTKPVTCF